MHHGFCVSISSWKFPHIFFVCNLRTPIGSHWFKKVLLELFNLHLYLFFFHKMMKFYKAIFSAWISSTSVKHFFSQKYNRNIFDLLKCTSMDFFRLFRFWQESHWFYTSFLKKNYIHIIYQCCYQFLMLLFGRISPGAIISLHLKI